MDALTKLNHGPIGIGIVRLKTALIMQGCAYMVDEALTLETRFPANPTNLSASRTPSHASVLSFVPVLLTLFLPCIMPFYEPAVIVDAT